MERLLKYIQFLCLHNIEKECKGTFFQMQGKSSTNPIKYNINIEERGGERMGSG